MVRGVGSFVHTCINFYADYPADFVIDARGYQNISFDPRGMYYNGDFDGRDEVLMKMTTFGIIPHETFILEGNEVME